MGEDAQQEIRPRRRVVRALDDQRRPPLRREAVAHARLRHAGLEALLVPLQHGVAAHQALLLAALVRTPHVGAGMLALAHGRGRGVHRHPLVDVGVLRLRALRVRLAVEFPADGAQVVEEHGRTIRTHMDARTITVDGLRLRVIDAAPERERDDAVLMIHGLAGWAENWKEIVPAVVESGRRAVAIDLPGFGASERPRRARYF